jgi:hypothetical protein
MRHIPPTDPIMGFDISDWVMIGRIGSVIAFVLDDGRFCEGEIDILCHLRMRRLFISSFVSDAKPSVVHNESSLVASGGSIESPFCRGRGQKLLTEDNLAKVQYFSFGGGDPQLW